MSSVTDKEASCHQEEKLKTDVANGNATGHCGNKEQQDASILTLNDDCLEYICNKLPVQDQIHFALACQRFFNVMTMISKIHHAYEHTDNIYRWSPEVIKNFFQVVGTHIKHLDIDYLPNQSILFELIPSCRNVEKLKVRNNYVDTDLMITLIDNMQKLEELNMAGTEIDDNALQYLAKFKRLKILSITSNYNVTGKNIELLKGLENLSIYQCFHITSENFRNICTNLKNLRHLNILHHSFLKPGDCTLISKNLLLLETLKLSCSHDDINCLTALPKLKKLAIQVGENRVDFFKKLAHLKGNQLEELSLHSTEMNKEVVSTISTMINLKVLHINSRKIYDEFLFLISKLTELEELKLSLCHLITDKSVLEIFEKCLKLKRLDLECCDDLTPALFEDAVKLLKKQHDDHQRKDRIVMTGTYTFCYNKLKIFSHLAKKFSDLIDVSLEEENGCDYSDSYLDDLDEGEYDHIWE